jgi:hypothetical protein
VSEPRRSGNVEAWGIGSRDVTGETESIVLCEPQCWGFEHASFNAALLQTVLIAYPGAALVFMGEADHLACVREALDRASCPLHGRVRWQEVEIPLRTVGGWRRLRSESVWCRRVLSVARDPQVNALVICSITETGLLVLKGMLQTHRIPVPVLVTIHGILASVEGSGPRRPWNWATHLRQVLRLPHPRQLTYLALSDSIRVAVSEAMPGVVSHFRAVDPPYFMPSVANAFMPGAMIRFGHFGVARDHEKNFGLFAQLAEEVGRCFDPPLGEFWAVGFLDPSAGNVTAREASVKGLSRAPLSAEEYAWRAQSIAYAVGLANPLHYRLVVNASFLDALCYLKPGIYLRNPYIEYYFNRLGDIGYLCDSYDQVRDVVFSVLREFPQGRYREQCANILRGRRMFEPEVIAPQLRAIVAAGRETAVG